MQTAADRIPGVNLTVDDLVSVRGQLSDVFLSKIRRRSSHRSNLRATRMRGRGMEYEESRAYVPGDDMRTMDWRVMARTGEAHTKVFAEEKEHRFLLAVDLSPSMFFGTRYSFKSWAAAHTAAHIGWLASFAGNRIGGLIAAPESHHEVRPGKTRSGLLGVFHYLAETVNAQRPASGTEQRLNFLLRELQRVVKPGSMVALISDFIGVDDESAESLSSLVKHNDVNAFWIHDQMEVEPWPAGRYPVRLEQDVVEIFPRGEDSWVARSQRAYRANIETLMSGFDIPLFPVSCNREITPQIVDTPGMLK